MPSTGKRIFVSYSHKDDERLVQQIFTHLYGLRQSFADLEIWIDRNMIRVGDTWSEEISEALAGADLAVLIISPEFFASSFILKTEQPRLLARRDQSGLPLVPIMLKPCARPTWLAATEFRPRGDDTLADLHARESAAVDRALKQVMDEIAEILGGPPRSVASAAMRVPAPANNRRDGGDMTETRCIALLTDTLLSAMAPDAGAALAAKLVRDIAAVTELTGAPLFDAVRFFIEVELLRSDALMAPAALEKAIAVPEKGGKAGPLVAPLRERARTEDFASTPVEVGGRFFARTNEKAGLWKRYFDHLIATGVVGERDVASLVPIRVTTGYLSAQFLVAGLLSRFNEDWRTVLTAYQRSIPPRNEGGAFQSLQASQWNCWLMWGPSIPVCQCWTGLFALQYGYGDENNSIPVVELVTEAGVPKTLGPVARQLQAEGRGARRTVLTGHLRWGPFFLERAQSERVLRDDDDDLDKEPSRGKIGMALAQASLYEEEVAHRRDSDSVVLELMRVDESLPETRVYFSAYLWTMFLVATAVESDQEPGIGPALLRDKRYPQWSHDPAERRRFRDAELWADLVPIFVHANIGDPAALAFQKQILVENSLQLLRQLWDRRSDLFQARDVATGIRFYLVAASDYSGCGCEIRFPVQHSLVAELRRRLAGEPDRAFAESVVLPPEDETPATRRWGLIGFFSACHLPEMIHNYYDHVAHLDL